MSPLFSAALALILPALQSGPSPTLTLDLNSKPTGLPVASSSPRKGPGSAGERVYFLAQEFESTELWASDGTAAGTGTLLSAGDAPFGADEPGAELPGGRFIFSRVTETTGAEPGVIDPAQPGSQLLRDVVIGLDGSFPTGFTAWRDAVWFIDVPAGGTASGTRTIYRTDGTTTGTTAEQERGLPFNVPSTNLSDASIGVAGDQLFLYLSDFPATLPQLWVKRSPDEPFVLLRAFEPGFGGMLQAAGDRIVFAASAPGTGIEPWSSDGTVAGTQPLADLSPGVSSSAIQFLASQDGWLWFNSRTSGPGAGLWVTDGTSAGTFLSQGVMPDPDFGSANEFAGYQGSLLFVRNANPRGVFRADPPSGVPATAGFVEPSTTQIFSTAGATRTYGLAGHAGDAYFFSGPSGGGQSLYRTAGQPGDAQTLAVLGPTGLGASAIPGPLGSTPHGLLFRGVGPAGIELWRTDGSPGGTGLLVDIARAPETESSSPRSLTRLRDGLWFGATPENGLPEVFFSDGSAVGTVSLSAGLLQAFSTTDDPEPLGTVSDRLLFVANQPGIGRELWSTDGTPGGTQLVADVRPGPTSGVASVPAVVIDNQLIFNGFNDMGAPFAGSLWRSDGTTAGTLELLPDGVTSETKAALGGRAYFSRGAPPAGVELWSTDGTPAGTQLVADLRPGPINSAPRELTVVGDQLFFRALNDNGWELAVSDGTAGGTRYLGTTAAGMVVDFPSDLVAVGQRLLFFAQSADGQSRDLWVSDGTAAGTNLLGNSTPFAFGPNGVEPPVASGDRAFFFGSIQNPSFPGPGASPQRSLWVTNGTTAGTRIVDVGPGTAAFYAQPPSYFAAERSFMIPVGSAGEIVFNANDEVHGFEPWISDGTPAGTRLLADLRPGAEDSEAYRMEDIGRLLMVAADDGVTGLELHALPLDFATGYRLEPYGTGCGASLAAGGSARLGKTAILDLSSGAPNQVAYLFVSAAPAWIQVGSGCTQYLAQPLLRNVLPTDATGFLSIGLPIPSIPALVGLEFYFQHLVTSPGGPLLGAFELSNGVEAILGA